MISEIDTISVVDETESTKVTTESQMAECSTELMRRPETTDGRWIPAGMQECLAGVTLMIVSCLPHRYFPVIGNIHDGPNQSINSL